MRRRTSILAVVATVAATAVGLSPAHAALDTPIVSNLDSSTAGHVAGTVTSIAPFVRVRLNPYVGATMVTMTEGSGTFDLETWGYAGTRSVYVSSCEVAEPTQAEDCSTEVASTATFVPTDVLPEVTWPSDTTLGPEDSPTITVSDPLGGGDLRARWVSGDDFLDTALVRDVETPLDIPTGTGVIRVVRCSTGSATICTPFDPDLSIPVELRTGVTGTLGQIDALTTPNPASSAAVDTDVTGSYDLIWTLEQEGAPVAGVGGTGSGVLTDEGATDPFLIEGAALPEGQYDVVVSLTLTGTEYGDLPGGASGTVRVDRTGPAVTLTPSVGTIYPLIATKAYPTLTRIDVGGDPNPDTGFVVRTAGSGVVVRDLLLNLNKTVWNGRNNAGKVVASGPYRVYAVDADGNLGASFAAVTVSRQTLVLKKFVTRVSASGSIYGPRKIGVCSQLKIPSSRGVLGSLGFYANTKCRTQGFEASAVSTSHFIKVPVAQRYVDMRIDVTGGAAVGYGGSKGILRYLKDPGTSAAHWVNETAMSSAYGIHRGPTQSLTSMLDTERFLVWGFLTFNGSRYDVIRFTVVVRYYVLSAGT